MVPTDLDLKVVVNSNLGCSLKLPRGSFNGASSTLGGAVTNFSVYISHIEVGLKSHKNCSIYNGLMVAE